MNIRIFVLFLSGLLLIANSTIAQTNSAGLPYVWLERIRTNAFEGGQSGLLNIKCSPTYTNGVTVLLAASGTASNGVDYVQIPEAIAIPAGSTNVLLEIQAIDDAISEPPTETAIISIRTATNFYSLSPNYGPSSGGVNIRDNDNVSPTVTIIAPANESTFNGPGNIQLQAQANDSDGWIKRVEFYRGTILLGSVLGQDLTNVYSFIWSNAQPASAPYVITARAYDNFDVKSTSAPVSIAIVGTANQSPTATMLSPANGSVFNLPTNILLRASATDSDGTVSTVQFFRGTTFIGNGVTAETANSYSFIWSNAVAGEYAISTVATDNLQARGTSAPVNIQIVGAPVQPKVRIVNPTNNASFTAPARIEISADPITNAAAIVAVEFFAGTNSIGSVTNTNSLGRYFLAWTNVSAGSYVLTAKAKSNQGSSTTSEPVQISVIEADPQPTVVSITAVDPEAGEGSQAGTSISGNTALFKLERSGSTNTSLAVSISVGGTASNGVDFVSIPGTITIPAGSKVAQIVLSPIDDQLVESNENVIISIIAPLCAAVYPPPPGCYEVGGQGFAVATILDNDFVNEPPSVRVTSPTNGSVFFGPLNVPVAAEASDSNGQVTRVDFYAGDRWLGADLTAPYSVTWSNALPGIYGVKAKATDNLGGVRMSEPVSVTIRAATEISFVRRTLPVWYVPGVKLRVNLRAEPFTNTTSYSIEDLPPAGWTVNSVLNGAVDSNDGKVKFGPFNDGLPRSFSYEVTPPATIKGEKRFFGNGFANGVTSPILGASVIVNAPAHPADRSGTNFIMSVEEVNAYSQAWRKNERWAISPNPIPVNYVTRAGFVYASGGGYALSTNYPTPFPPLLWVSTNATTPVEVPSNSGTIGWTTNRMGTAVSSIPTNYAIGVPMTVTIQVTPSTSVFAHALEERPPIGWIVTNISHDGVYNRETGQIRWGLFLTNTNRLLSYDVIPTSANAPASAYFSGVASFDGINVPITGQRQTRRTTTSQPAKLESVKILSDGNRLLTFTGEAGVGYVLEATTNFVDWVNIEALLNNDGVLQYIDLSTNEDQRFYRAVPAD